MLTVPILLFFGLPGPVANGTNRVGIVLQNLAACGTFFRKGYTDWKLGVSLALASLPGAVLGAFVGTRLEGEWFERVVALVMLIVLVLMLKPSKPLQEDAMHLTPQRLFWGHVAMAGVGVWGGFIQIGVGFIIMPVLHRVLGLNLVRVNQHKVFIVLIYSLVALWVFFASGQVMWLIGLALALGNALGGWLGAHSTLKGGEALIRPIFVGVILVFILLLLI